MKIITTLRTYFFEILVVGVLLIVFGTLIWTTIGRKRLPSQSVEASTNPGIQVEFVLEHDGVKVYRFWDGYRTIYYTDARGKTSWQEYHSTGKSSYTTDEEVENVR